MKLFFLTTTNNQPDKKMKKTSVTLKTLTLAATAATFTLASPPAANAVDWHAPVGTTTFYGTVGSYDNIYVGSLGGESIVNLTYYFQIYFSTEMRIGWNSPGIVNLDEGRLYSNVGTIYVGDEHYGELNILDPVYPGLLEVYRLMIGGNGGSGHVRVGGFAGRVDSPYIHVGDEYGGMTGKLTVNGNGDVSANTLYIHPNSAVEVSEEASISANIVMEAGSRLTVVGDGAGVYSSLLSVEAGAEFTIGLHGMFDSISYIYSGSVNFTQAVALTVLAEEIFAEGEQFLILEGAPVDGLWGYDPIIAADTGQVFDISYDELNAGVYETYLVARAIPEPSTYALIGSLGALALAALRRWRRRG